MKAWMMETFVTIQVAIPAEDGKPGYEGPYQTPIRYVVPIQGKVKTRAQAEAQIVAAREAMAALGIDPNAPITECIGLYRIDM